MTDRERQAVLALVYMTRQFLQRSVAEEWIDSRAMSAGEATILALGEYGLMTVKLDGRAFGKWNADAIHALETGSGT